MRDFSAGPMTLLLVLALVGQVRAHDLWLIPPDKVESKQPVVVRAHSGSEFPVSEYAPDPTSFARRTAIGPDGKPVTLEVSGTKDTSGLLRLQPSQKGTYVVAVETKPKIITLDAHKFNAYLVSDGLPHIYLLRSKEKSLDQPGSERYSKSPKALVRVESSGGESATRPVGLPLEIVPLKDPFGRKVGDTLQVRVLFAGKPLAQANLGYAHPNEGETPRGTVRTDTNGEALVPIAKSGLMTIRLTHMTRPKAAEYEWESFWTTLTWLVPE